ncbi:MULTISPECIES: MerR family transcriptional regulator [Streptomyces]|uniref:MerR family transcriptional regulator n=1 Tax=Streptomyces eurythermus TaxID=42237 RepID=A0ABW6YSS4_9ACTN|nr:MULTISPECIES: MerR family transcriptional regulator [Streptomyces]QIS69081.1 MerR family transcriptional regulator [Streptomyces sp. DSM 40868]
MSPDGTLSIGDLAARARTTVKTIRFYSDQGLLPEAARSSGGHRRYGPDALARLRTIRSLRALDVPVPEIKRVLESGAGPEPGEGLEAVVARRLDAIGGQLAALRWREAALRALQECEPGQLAERLELIGAVSVPPDTSAIAHYWRRLLPVRLSARLRTAITEAAVPQPPADPTPDQVIAFARVHALATAATDHCLAGHRPVTETHPDLLYDGLYEAHQLVEAAVRAGRAPGPGEALDCYAAAYARAAGTRDTPAFRQALAARLAAADHPVMHRYWQLAGALIPGLTLGAADAWLRDALTADTATG